MGRQIYCPSCGAAIPDKMIHADQNFAVCPACKTIYDFADKPKQRAYEVPRPSNVTVTKMDEELLISFPTISSSRAIAPIFSVIMLDLFMIFLWSGIGFSSPLLFIFVPLMLIGNYGAIATLLNTTTVHASATELSFHTVPLPWFGNKTLESRAIEQLYCKQKFYRRKHHSDMAYEIHAIMKGGRHEVFTKILSDPDLALYIEQEVEAYLGIQNVPVRGEFQG